MDADVDMDWVGVPEEVQDDDTFECAMRDILGTRSVFSFTPLLIKALTTGSVRTHKDNRTWGTRLKRLQENWAPLMTGLVQAYLHWSTPRPSPDPLAHLGPSCSEWAFDINVIDIYTLDTGVTIPRTADVPVAEALVLSGYLGTSPLCPSFAVSLKTLELYRRIRIRKPSFSLEAFAKVLCDFYVVS